MSDDNDLQIDPQKILDMFSRLHAANQDGTLTQRLHQKLQEEAAAKGVDPATQARLDFIEIHAQTFLESVDCIHKPGVPCPPPPPPPTQEKTS